MYEKMVKNYRVWFEGLPEPVFYKSFYPMGGNDADWMWDMFHYAQGLKNDKDEDWRSFNRWHSLYDKDLRSLLNTVIEENPGASRGVVTIPSSELEKTNRITLLVREVLSANPRPFADLTKVVVRTKDKVIQHGGGKRSFKANIDTTGVLNPALVSSLDVIVVVDDILTSGTSFRAMDEVLRGAGFKGILYNFAFARTTPGVGVKNILHHEPGLMIEGFPGMNSLERRRPQTAIPVYWGYQVITEDGKEFNFTDYKIQKKAGYIKERTESGAYRVGYDPSIIIELSSGETIEFSDLDDVRSSLKNIRYVRGIDAIVYDFDQTLLEDPIRDVAFEEQVLGMRDARFQPPDSIPYGTYDGIDELIGLEIPFAIVSNRPITQLVPLIRSKQLERVFYPDKYLEGEADEAAARRNEAYQGYDTRDNRSFMHLFKKINLPDNFFSFPRTENESGFAFNLYKPCVQGIENALNFLSEHFQTDSDSRILGVGNTHEDIVAYNMAGLESCLALWGVPDYLKEHARRHWGADHVFETVAEFIQWCRNGGPVHFFEV